MTDTYQCANCRGTFQTGWSDEEAQAEYDANFPIGSRAREEVSVVCDDCYNTMIAWKLPSQYEAEETR